MTVWYLAIALLLLGANAFFVAAEFGLIAARPTKLEQLFEAGDQRAGAALRSAREISFMLAGTQLGITMASLGLGYVAEPAVARLIEQGLRGALTLSDGASHALAIVIALAIVVFLHMVIGEMAPKNLAIAEPERTALAIARTYRVYATGFRPVIHILNKAARGILALLRVEQKKDLVAARSREEIGLLISESAKGGMLRAFEHRLLSGAVAFGSRDAGAVMIPRTEIVPAPVTATPRDLEALVVETGHSRLAIYRGDLDDVVGFFHAKDLLKVEDDAWDEPLRPELVRQMLVVPESLRLHPLMLEMRRRRMHVALVVEEHGGTAGIVTLEDVLEELVGEILDEYDEDQTQIQRLPQERFLVPGSLRIDEASERLGVDLPPGEYETIAGFMMDRLGRIPRRNDAVSHGDWVLRILSMYRRRVVKILIERLPEEAAPRTRASDSRNG